ncbi:ABC-F family ATP-binding cassette domain-containing protein [Mollicutes bacterium LVI A0039]|nr:ABC-F family ATP-binding cassette domain-containing protein [Mollicutes bacterium LVI A0039]
MITLSNISKHYGSEVLFQNVNLTINKHDKVAIIGDNGVGKTTLLKIILDDSLATDGEVRSNKLSIGYLSQRVIEDVKNTAMQEFNQVFRQITNTEALMFEVLEQLETDPSNELLVAKYGQLENKFLQLGGYDKQVEINKMLTAFGFSEADVNRTIESFSGGERTKLALIKLLLLKPDYLLLDEPTNHLDIQTIEWLESYLRSYEGAVIIISHDRYFLDKVVTKIIEIENQTVSRYNTNYTNYLIEKELRYNHQLANYERQQKEITELNSFIERFRNKPSKIGQVNDRKSKLERMEIIPKPLDHFKKISFEFESLHLKRSSYVEIIDGEIGYPDDDTLIQGLNLRVDGGDKIGIIGPNGIGKTTLLKTMLKQIPIKSGQVLLHQKIKIGYFDQQQNDLDTSKTIFDVIKPYMPDESDSFIRRYLGRFLFTGRDVFKKIGDLSGGEKIRVVLAQFALEEYDLIILDEPTNHLDLKSKEVLGEALMTYQGTILCVSHDRYFMNQLIKKYVLLQPHSYSIFEGKYDNYVDYMEQTVKVQKEKKQKQIVTKKKINRNLGKLEKKIENQEQELSQLTEQSMLPEIYNDFVKADALRLQIAECDKQLNLLMEEYENELMKEV